MQKIEKIKNFIIGRIKQIDNLIPQQTDLQEKLNLTTKRISFSNILKSYFQYSSQTSFSYIYQANTYYQLQCYQQAIHNAKIAKKNLSNGQNKSQILQRIQILIIECLIKQQKFNQAKELIQKLQIKSLFEEYYKTYNKIMSKLLIKQKCQIALQKLEAQVINKYTKNSLQYGLFLIQRGRTNGIFNQTKKAIQQMSLGMDILIEKEHKNIKQIYGVYKQLSVLNRSLNNIQSQYTNLICAQAMLRQMANHEKQLIEILHYIARNLQERQLYDKALLELQKVESLQREVYGDSSNNIAKTLKKISNLLIKLERKNEARNYQRQYLRVIGNSKEKGKLKNDKIKTSNK